jgi:hypothetical protein
MAYLNLVTTTGTRAALKMTKSETKHSWGGDNIKLVVSNNGVTYTDFHNKTETIVWDEIRQIWWEPNAPEYGFSHWVLFGDKRSIEIDERSALNGKLLEWFDDKLAGFDRDVVIRATNEGYFEADEYKTLICWTK